MCHAWRNTATPSESSLAWSTGSWPIREFHLNNSLFLWRVPCRFGFLAFFQGSKLSFRSFLLLSVLLLLCLLLGSSHVAGNCPSRRFRYAMNTVSGSIVSHTEEHTHISPHRMLKSEIALFNPRY